MIGFVAEEGVEEGLAGGLMAAAAGLDGDEDGVDFGDALGIVEAHDPAALGFVVHVENSQIHR